MSKYSTRGPGGCVCSHGAVCVYISPEHVKVFRVGHARANAHKCLKSAKRTLCNSSEVNEHEKIDDSGELVSLGMGQRIELK